MQKTRGGRIFFWATIVTCAMTPTASLFAQSRTPTSLTQNTINRTGSSLYSGVGQDTSGRSLRSTSLSGGVGAGGLLNQAMGGGTLGGAGSMPGTSSAIADEKRLSAIDEGDALVAFADSPSVNEEAIRTLNAQPAGMYRPRLKVNMADFPPANAKVSGIDRRLLVLQEHLQTRLVRSTGSITLALDGETLVLTGSVENEQQKKLLERVVRLEPGVTVVRNELVVR